MIVLFEQVDSCTRIQKVFVFHCVIPFLAWVLFLIFFCCRSCNIYSKLIRTVCLRGFNKGAKNLGLRWFCLCTHHSFKSKIAKSLNVESLLRSTTLQWDLMYPQGHPWVVSKIRNQQASLEEIHSTEKWPFEFFVSTREEEHVSTAWYW